MTAILLILVLVIISAEFFLFKQRSKNKRNLSKVQNLNTKLGVLRSLSLALSSKRTSLKEDLEDIAVSFFVQNDYGEFSLIKSGTGVRGGREVWRYSNTVGQNQSRLDISQANKLESYLLNQSLEKSKQNQETSNIFWFNSWSKESLGLNEGETKWRGAAVVSLADTATDFKQAVFFSEKEILTDEELSFLTQASRIVTLLFRKWDFNNKLPVEEQFRAVNVIW